MSTGFMVAAPSSGAGKTTVTLGLLRALARKGAVRGAKSGPDYIDPQFHAAASGAECVNLDAWAMTSARLRHLARGDAPLIVEAAMGLFDGAPNGSGSAAQLAKALGIPILLVVDCKGASHSIAALVRGFATHDPDLQIKGVILNNIGSARHGEMIRAAVSDDLPPILGALPRLSDLSHPSRHLGLVQAQERNDLNAWLDGVADHIERAVDLTRLPFSELATAAKAERLKPPAQTIAIARDAAFAFSYPHMLKDWRDQGAELRFFSPLADDPVPEAGFIFLPGGYPELHAAKIANATTFLESLKKTSETCEIYGECGGYIVLGDGLIDADGARHQMAGLLRLETSFETRKLHLGYRHLTAVDGVMRGAYKGHEFHYVSTLKAEGDPLFEATDASGQSLHQMGLRAGRTCGSFAHLIDRSLP